MPSSGPSPTTSGSPACSRAGTFSPNTSRPLAIPGTMPCMATAAAPGRVRVVPANEATWHDLQQILAVGDGHGCQCQYFKLTAQEWRSTISVTERAERFREQTACGIPDAASTSGLVAYDGDEPAGWVAVEPRTAYTRLQTMRVPWSGRDEDKADDSVWAVTCFVVRRGFRRRGIASALTRTAVDFARDHGAAAVEGYPRVREADDDFGAAAAALYIGNTSMFEAAGFREISRPTARRVVMRIDF